MATTIPGRKVYKFRMEPTGREALELERAASKQAKSWLDAPFGELLGQVEYKAL